MKVRSRHCLLAFAAAFGLGALAAPAAHAFTFEGQGTNSDGSARYAEPSSPSSRFDSNTGQTTIRQGDATFHFGPQRSFDERYNADRLFEPLGRPGDPR